MPFDPPSNSTNSAFTHALGSSATEVEPTASPPSVASETAAPSNRLDRHFARRYPLRILVAEDNPINAMVIALILDKLGYAHDLAKNGVEAVAAARKSDYDAIVMDIQMPEMDGLEATRRILANPLGRHAPYIMALTANAQTHDCRECRKAGMSAFLAKPAYPATVAQALQRAFLARAPAAV